MANRFILITFMLSALLSFFALTTSAESSECPVDMVCYDSEFILGDNKINIVENTDYQNIGVWDDGSFFIHLGNKINIYDCNGEFSHCLGYDGEMGGSVKTVVGDDLTLKMWFIRPNVIATVDKSGEIISWCYGPEGNAGDEFDGIERSLFSKREYNFTTENGTILVTLPPRVAFPGNDVCHITLVRANSGEVIFDDSGKMFKNEFSSGLAIFGGLSVALTAVAVVFMRRRKGLFTK